jgi:hypothetical protein
LRANRLFDIVKPNRGPGGGSFRPFIGALAAAAIPPAVAAPSAQAVIRGSTAAASLKSQIRLQALGTLEARHPRQHCRGLIEVQYSLRSRGDFDVRSSAAALPRPH